MKLNVKSLQKVLRKLPKEINNLGYITIRINGDIMALSTQDYEKIGRYLDAELKPYNYQVAPLAPNGKPGKQVKSMREYRLQLINKQQDTSDKLIQFLPGLLKRNSQLKGVTFNKISPNSSKFPSVSFTFDNQVFDLVIGRGANKGENFETATVGDLASVFRTGKGSPDYMKLIQQLNDSNKEFAAVEVVKVTQRTGSTKKEGVPIENLGAIIGDIVLEDSTKNKWFISLKDVNGYTFSSYSGAASLIDSEGNVQLNSAGAKFLEAFGADLNKVQLGFDIRASKLKGGKAKARTSPAIPVKRADPQKIKAIFERAWGMNYFYVKKEPGGWKTFWIDRAKLSKLTGNIRVTDIQYPSAVSKQISIFCENTEQKYLIEVRNSKGGEYPNDIKIKIRK